MDMEEAIKGLLRAKSPSEIKDLNLDNRCKATRISPQLAKFTRLESLSLNGISLASLDGFPSLPALKELELADNRITDGLEALLAAPNLERLQIAGNGIKSLAAIKVLAKLKNLSSLDLYGNPVTNIQKYRETVFKEIPTLTVLDGMDAQGNEMEPEEDEEEEEEEEDDLDDKLLSKPYGKMAAKALPNGKGEDAGEGSEEDGEEEEEVVVEEEEEEQGDGDGEGDDEVEIDAEAGNEQPGEEAEEEEEEEEDGEVEGEGGAGNGDGGYGENAGENEEGEENGDVVEEEYEEESGSEAVNEVEEEDANVHEVYEDDEEEYLGDQPGQPEGEQPGQFEGDAYGAEADVELDGDQGFGADDPPDLGYLDEPISGDGGANDVQEEEYEVAEAVDSASKKRKRGDEEVEEVDDVEME